jgi:pyoverdine/dityrosine biosynthesis protein Dit1
MGALSDEQTDLLYQNQKVLDARRAFLKKLAEGMRRGDLEMIAEGNALKKVYETLFAEHLKWVIENPPEPKAKPMVSFNGFARRA